MIPQPDAEGWTLRVDPAWPGFAGHFPGDPILPGAEMIELARHCAGIDPAAHDLIKARFTRAVRPGDLLRIRCTQRPGRLVVTLAVDAETAAEIAWRSGCGDG